MQMLFSFVLGAAVSAFSAVALAAPPAIVPEGWKLAREPGGTARTFVSPDGSARIRFGHEPVQAGNRQADATRFVRKPGERITYQQRGDTWFVVSGYREGEIFYRKGNLACRGSRWNLIEFRYPRDAKEKMDATVTAIAHNMGAYRNDCG